VSPDEKRRLGWAVTFVRRKHWDSDVAVVCAAVEKYILGADTDAHTGTHQQTQTGTLSGCPICKARRATKAAAKLTLAGQSTRKEANMPHGGKRAGAGRPRGSLNRLSAEVRTVAVMAAAASGDELPLQYMLRIMNDPNADPQRRDYMAKAAAAYVHPRLNSTEVGGKEGCPVVIEITPDEAKY
jgi:hypothetical protein